MSCNPCKKTRIIKTGLKVSPGKYGNGEVVVKSISSYRGGIIVNNTDGSRYNVNIEFNVDGIIPINLYNASGSILLGTILAAN